MKKPEKFDLALPNTALMVNYAVTFDSSAGEYTRK